MASPFRVRYTPYTAAMKRIIPAMLAVAISLVPLGATAGEPPAPVPPPPPMLFGHDIMFGHNLNLTQSQQQQFQQIMQQTGQQMEQLHAQARAKVLGALSPAHRALLAQVVGSLAVSLNPDPQGAVRQLNAALSAGEAQAVISAHNAAIAQMHQLMENTHQRFQAVLTAQQRSQLSSEHGGMMYSRHEGEMKGMEQLSAGEILLHFAQFDAEGPGMGFDHPMMGLPH